MRAAARVSAVPADRVEILVDGLAVRGQHRTGMEILAATGPAGVLPFRLGGQTVAVGVEIAEHAAAVEHVARGESLPKRPRVAVFHGRAQVDQRRRTVVGSATPVCRGKSDVPPLTACDFRAAHEEGPADDDGHGRSLFHRTRAVDVAHRETPRGNDDHAVGQVPGQRGGDAGKTLVAGRVRDMPGVGKSHHVVGHEPPGRAVVGAVFQPHRIGGRDALPGDDRVAAGDEHLSPVRMQQADHAAVPAAARFPGGREEPALAGIRLDEETADEVGGVLCSIAHRERPPLSRLQRERRRVPSPVDDREQRKLGRDRHDLHGTRLASQGDRTVGGRARCDQAEFDHASRTHAQPGQRTVRHLVPGRSRRGPRRQGAEHVAVVVAALALPGDCAGLDILREVEDAAVDAAGFLRRGDVLEPHSPALFGDVPEHVGHDVVERDAVDARADLAGHVDDGLLTARRVSVGEQHHHALMPAARGDAQRPREGMQKCRVEARAPARPQARDSRAEEDPVVGEILVQGVDGAERGHGAFGRP